MTSTFVAQLSRLAVHQPTRAKWVFVPSHVVGRTLGDRLALDGTDWANFRFVMPLEIALRMGAPFLVERGIDPSEEGLGPALMMRLLMGLPAGTDYFRPLADQPQLAMALWSTVRELRLAGVRAAGLPAGAFASREKHAELRALLDAYETFLANTSRADRAMVFEEALAHADWCPIQPQDCWTEMPGVIWSPLERRLLDVLPGERMASDDDVAPGVARPRRLASATEVPPPAAAAGVPAATITFFQAGGAEAEVEEVFRRVLASGRPLDRVEIACASIGGGSTTSLIWEKALRYGWPVTLATGIPATLTRPGRALLGFADWIEDEFSSGLLRRLLQSGDVTLGRDSALTPGRAARLLVQAQAAWGRETYRLALGRYATSSRQRADRDDIPADEARWLMARATDADALRAWLDGVIGAVPVPDGDGRVALHDVVAGARAFLAGSGARASALDHAAATRLDLALGELEALGEFRCPMRQALRFVRERVESLSVGADRPRPGHLHVSPIGEAGLSGRPVIFVVGLEEGRVFVSGLEDPILLDAERERLHPDLRRSGDVLDEAVYAVLGGLLSMAARPDAEMCLSFSCRDLRQFRDSYASWVMLHLYRVATGDRRQSYRDLRQHLGAPVSCVPAVDDEALGPGRWWLRGVVTAGERAGRAAVLRHFPSLAAGVRADEARRSARFTEYDGYVPEAGPVLDPCGADVVVSPTQLEEAAQCAFRYFLRRGLRINAIETGDRDRDVWLNPLIRGSLLHDLYAALLRRCRDARRTPTLADDRDWLRARGEATLAGVDREMPAPSLEVRDRETRDFLADLDLFLDAEVEVAGTRAPVALEVGFGRARAGDAEPLSMNMPVTVRVGGLTFRVAGRVDRIDQLADGRFEILDYKTGGYWAADWQGTFAGGRRLQHALYGLAAAELLKPHTKTPRIAGAQYYFSSAKGRLERKIIPAPSVAAVGQVLADLREVITGGLFVHAAEARDCTFCNYGAVCGLAAQSQAAAKQNDDRLKPARKLASHE